MAPSRVGAAHRVGSPDRWLVRAAWAVIGLSSLQIVLFAFGRDQGIYAVVAEAMLRGELPYRDAWDFKPPGIYLIYALAQGLFGKSMVSVRLLEVLGLLVMTFAFVRLSRVLFGERTIGVVAGALSALVHAQLEFWHSGQPETFGGALTALALLCAVRARMWALSDPRRSVWLMAAMGVLFGCTFLLKPPLGGGAVVGAAYLMRIEGREGRPVWPAWKPFVLVAAASVLPIAACGAWFWAKGGWDALRWTLFDFVPGYSAINRTSGALAAFYYAFQEAFAGFSALLAAGSIASIVLRPMHGREAEGLLLLIGVVCMHVAGVAMQAKFFQYHYAATLPLIALIAALGIYKAFRRAVSAGPQGVLAFAFAIVVLAAMQTAVRDTPGTFWERSAARLEFLLKRDRDALDAELYNVADYDIDDDRAIARELSRRVRADESVFVWGFEPVIYWLSDRRPASRYIYNVAQRVRWDRERARTELMDDLHRNRPAAIVVQHTDVFHHVTGNQLDSAAAVHEFDEFEKLLDERYAFERSVGKFDLYLRRN